MHPNQAPTPTTRPVPQCTYSLTDPNRPALATGRISSCMAIAGVDKAKRVAFLAHLDTPFAAVGIDRVLNDARAAAGGSLDGFELHDVAGMSPWLPVLALAMVIPGFLMNVTLGAGLLLFGALYSATRATLLIRLRQLGIDTSRIKKHRPHSFLNLHRRTVCTVSRDGDLKTEHDTVMDRIYETPRGVWFRLTRRDL